ncbi:hypothetical protein [Nocardioides albus]|uniref:Uncharacterized protein n=1 Tax=Nocardioides albus TaxID=1841 RepID=A0A7W5A857_9ACTN|nr:hypothetical protein [Nocardioides albus]MBB3090974.1 hypothetical protein [Nocardioides albus]
MVEDGDLGAPWKATARRVGWSLLSLANLLFGLLLCVGFLVADGAELGPYLIGVTCGVMFVLLAVAVQLMKGVRLGDRRAQRRIRRSDGGAGIEIRLRRGPGICGELMLVCFVVMLCQFAGLAFRGGLNVVGVLSAGFAVFFAVVVVDHALTMTMRRALLITPESLTIELAGEVVTVAWKEIRVDVVEEVTRHDMIPVTNRFLEFTARRDAPSWSNTRRHRIRLVPRRWRRKAIRVGFWLLDDPERVVKTLTSLRRRRDDNARRVVLSNGSTLAYLTGELEVSPLPSER